MSGDTIEIMASDGTMRAVGTRRGWLRSRPTRPERRLTALHYEALVPATLERTFAFFSDPANLERLTPDWLRFEIVTPRPIEMRAGLVIEYRLRLYGVPLGWTSRIDLALTDRGIYESLSMRVARHPSESEDYFVTRILAYCCEFAPGIEFSSGGLSDPDDPPIAVRDLTGRLQTWIDIGTPSADRLHRASKAAPRVVVYQGREASQWLDSLGAARIHRAEALEIWLFDRELMASLIASLDRRMSLAVALADDELLVAIGATTMSGCRRRQRLQSR